MTQPLFRYVITNARFLRTDVWPLMKVHPMTTTTLTAARRTPRTLFSLSNWTYWASALLLMVGLNGVAVLAQEGQEPKVDRWEAEISKFEEADRSRPPVPGGNLFVGSSSIRLWSVKDAFPEHSCVNRGFGGAQFPDLLRYFDRYIPQHQAAVIVLYCGDNDIGAKRTPLQVRDDYRTFVDRVHARAPETKIVWIPIKPSGKRWHLRDAIQEANALVSASQEGHPHEISIDIWPAMLGEDGLPRDELYAKDQLHLSPAGYAVWNRLVEPHLVQGMPKP